MKIGVIGAGLVARAVMVQALRHGHQVMLSNSRGPQSLFTIKAAFGCETGTAAEAAAFGDIVVAAVPLSAYRAVPIQETVGKIVVDTNNYYPARDGHMTDLDERSTTTSELLARHLPKSHIIKAFNAIIAMELEQGGLPAGTEGRRALPIAGGDVESKKIIVDLHDQFGFDVVDVGPLSESWRFEEGAPAYCVAMDRDQLIKALSEISR